MGIKTAGINFNHITFKKLEATSLLYDDFTSGIDSSRWGTFSTHASTSYDFSVASSELSMTLNSAVDRFQTVGLKTKTKFSVGTKVTAKIKHTTGQHATFMGFANSVSSPAGHANNTPAISWYGRSLTGASVFEGDTTVGSYKDENGDSEYVNYPDVDHRTYKILEMERVDENTVVFRIDGQEKHVTSGIQFAGDYSVFIAVDSHTVPCQMVIDWIEIS